MLRFSSMANCRRQMSFSDFYPQLSQKKNQRCSTRRIISCHRSQARVCGARPYRPSDSDEFNHHRAGHVTDLERAVAAIALHERRRSALLPRMISKGSPFAHQLRTDARGRIITRLDKRSSMNENLTFRRMLLRRRPLPCEGPTYERPMLLPDVPSDFGGAGISSWRLRSGFPVHQGQPQILHRSIARGLRPTFCEACGVHLTARSERASTAVLIKVARSMIPVYSKGPNWLLGLQRCRISSSAFRCARTSEFSSAQRFG